MLLPAELDRIPTGQNVSVQQEVNHLKKYGWILFIEGVSSQKCREDGHNFRQPISLFSFFDNNSFIDIQKHNLRKTAEFSFF